MGLVVGLALGIYLGFFIGQRQGGRLTWLISQPLPPYPAPQRGGSLFILKCDRGGGVGGVCLQPPHSLPLGLEQLQHSRCFWSW